MIAAYLVGYFRAGCLFDFRVCSHPRAPRSALGEHDHTMVLATTISTSWIGAKRRCDWWARSMMTMVKYAPARIELES